MGFLVLDVKSDEAILLSASNIQNLSRLKWLEFENVRNINRLCSFRKRQGAYNTNVDQKKKGCPPPPESEHELALT